MGLAVRADPQQHLTLTTLLKVHLQVRGQLGPEGCTGPQHDGQQGHLGHGVLQHTDIDKARGLLLS